MEFQLQSVYLIYTWLMVYITLNLAYSKEYVYYMLLTCDMTSFFQNLLCFFMTITCDCVMYYVIYVTVCDSHILYYANFNPKFKIRK